jgi:transcriptional regulator with XRE-family HTH domain
LAFYFRRLREQRGHTLEELGRVLGVAQSQASRLDSGARGFGVEDVWRLCDWYGLRPGEAGRLVALAEEARRRAWWQQIELPEAYRIMIGFERAAEAINEFCNVVIPGLLQTEEYAAAAARMADAGPSEIERAVQVRMRRQDILARPDPPELSVVIDEVVLARGAGGRRVMREQCERLLEFADRPRVTIRVIAFDAGMYPFHVMQFILMDMGRRLPGFYYTEGMLAASHSSDEGDLQQARRQWQQLQSRALTPAESVSLIARYRDGLIS